MSLSSFPSAVDGFHFVIAASYENGLGANAADITYTGSRTAGDLTAMYSFTTNGALGDIGNSKVMNYDVDITSLDFAAFDLNQSNSRGDFDFLATPTTRSDVLLGTSVESNMETGGFDDAAFRTFSTSGVFVIRRVEDATAGQGSPILATFAPAMTSPVISAVPEPATWLLMFGGVGVMGLMLRRRRTMGTLAAARVNSPDELKSPT